MYHWPADLARGIFERKIHFYKQSEPLGQHSEDLLTTRARIPLQDSREQDLQCILSESTLVIIRAQVIQRRVKEAPHTSLKCQNPQRRQSVVKFGRRDCFIWASIWDTFPSGLVMYPEAGRRYKAWGSSSPGQNPCRCSASWVPPLWEGCRLPSWRTATKSLHSLWNGDNTSWPHPNYWMDVQVKWYTLGGNVIK